MKFHFLAHIAALGVRGEDLVYVGLLFAVCGIFIMIFSMGRQIQLLRARVQKLEDQIAGDDRDKAEPTK
jgi:uncharacterized integral membrane protein